MGPHPVLLALDAAAFLAVFAGGQYAIVRTRRNDAAKRGDGDA